MVNITLLRRLFVTLWICTSGAGLLTSTVVAAEVLPNFERVMNLQSPREISDTQLTDQNGDSLSISELHGKVVLIFFGFTNCPDVCPMTMTRWRDLEKSGEVDLEKVEFVLISVDSERDNPEVMKEYLDKFSVRFIGLTGDKTVIKAYAKQFSAAFYKGSEMADGQYTVSHSPQAYVLDPAGFLRSEFYSPSVDAMAGIVNALLQESAENSR